MKNKLKSVRRGSNSAASPQSKTQHGKAPANSAGTVTCVWFLPDGGEAFRVDFPRELFSRIKRVATKLGITLEQFFDNAISHYAAECARRSAA